MTMRPRSFDDDSALEAAVSDLLRRFDALTDPAPAAGAARAAAVGGVIEDTFTVAGPNSEAAIRDAADYLTDEANDEVEIQAALDGYAYDIPGATSANPASRVVIAAGYYRGDGTITIPAFGTLEGSGVGTVLVASASTNFSIIMEGITTLKNLHIGFDGFVT